MRRDQLEHAIRTACQIVGHPAVAVVGSQAILGSFAEDELPPEATMSVEIDILPLADNKDEIARLADLIEGVAGEWSPFEEQHGFSIDGVDQETAVLPDGWRDRLVKVQNPNTQPRPPERPSTPGGASTRRTYASLNSVPSGRRTRTSWRRCSTPASSMPKSSLNALAQYPTSTSQQPSAHSAGLRPEPDT
jgi:hypothetical protein